jgi:dTDP-glucose 4,6-dehydratase
MKKILVTGGVGFIGVNFVRYMLETYPSYHIVNVDKLTYAGRRESIADIEQQYTGRHTFMQGDICDFDFIDAIVSGVDMIVHFAAETHVDTSIKDPGLFIHTNIVGTHTLLRAALKNNKVRFHHVSTDEVFGSLELESGMFNEESQYDPRSPYAASKASSDHLVQAYFHTYGLPITISNCSNNYGPYQFPEKIIPLFTLRALHDKPLPLYGDGKSVRDYLFVEDHCRALDMIIHHGTLGQRYCIGGGAEKNGIEIADTVLSVLQKPDTLKTFVDDRLGHDRRYAIDYNKIKSELGWEPHHSFDQGIHQTVTWYKENKNWWQDII